MKRTFYKTLTEAINYFAENGFKSEKMLDFWVKKLRKSAYDSLIPEKTLVKELERSLGQAYRRQVVKGGLLAKNPGLAQYTLEKLKPKMKAELDRRIVTSANLITLNRDEAISNTLRRFQGWATSIPVGGSLAVDKRKEKDYIRKSMNSLNFEERRVIIDQTNKLIANINDVVAKGNGAIAGIWHSVHRQGYNNRVTHLERDDKIYLFKDSKATRDGLVKPINGYVEDITMPGEEVFCFPGELEVPFADGVAKGFRRWYDGELVEIITTSNKPLRGTPNHPILTNNGWVALGSLKKGDYVAEVSVELLNTLKENKNNAVSSISDIFTALNKDGVIKTTNLRATDFHGDGIPDSNVDIVSAARPLTVGFAPDSLQSLDKFDFSEANTSTLSVSPLDKGVEAIVRASTGSMGASNTRHTPFGGTLSKSNVSSICDISDGDAFFLEPVSNDESTDPEICCKRFNTFASGIVFKQITDINRVGFSGHVYNLETKNHWYVAGTIIAHNCSCWYQYIYDLSYLPEEMLTSKGKTVLESRNTQVR